jgi:histidinol-phosphate aminotransferase
MKPAARFDKLPPYTPIEPFEVLSARLGLPADQITKLDANENPYGPSPKARLALASLAYTHVYPDPESRALRAGLAQFTGVSPEFLLAGAGADELIDLLLRVLIEPGDSVLTCPPTFGMYPFDTLLNAGQVVDVPRKADFSLDIPGLRSALRERTPKVAFLTAPNNPDGRFPTDEEVQILLDSECLVVIDEAYIEFTQGSGRLGEARSRIRQVAQRQNLVVLRTFSKWAGLAGLRVGYGAFPAWLMPVMWKAKQPYNVSVAASSAALASLDDLEALTVNVAKIQTERARLFDRLQSIPYLHPHPSDANFILCRVDGHDANRLKQDLAARGVLVRHYNTSLLHNYIRVSVGRPEDTNTLIKILKEIS